MTHFFSPLLFLLFIKFVYSDTFSKSISVQFGKKDSGTAIILSLEQESKYMCAVQCLNLKACLAVVYDSDRRLCSFLNSNATLVDTTDLRMLYLFIGDHCNDGWIQFGDSCYLFGDQTFTWAGALDFCKSEGATLVEIETPSENSFVQNRLSAITNPKHWIGMTDFDQEDVWVWASGVTVGYIDWGDLQPNNGRVSNCGAIWASFGYKWVDESCDNQFHPICEKSSSSAP